MFAKVVSGKLFGKFQKTLMVAVALILLFGSLPVDKAYAWSITPQSGKGGSVVLPQIHIGDQYMPYGQTQFTLYSQTGPVVYRSPAAAGAQTVSLVYVLETYVNGKWVFVTQSKVFNQQIGAAQVGTIFPALYVQPLVARGYFRLSYFVGWKDANGAGLGHSLVSSNLASDYKCVTTVRWCRTAPGWFQTGAYMENTW